MHFRVLLSVLVVDGLARGTLGESDRSLRGGSEVSTGREDIHLPIIVDSAMVPLVELDMLRLETIDFSLPVPDGVDEGHRNRSLEDNVITTWYCRTNDGGKDVGSVRIWWGHQNGDAEWACNSWISQCPQNGNCFAFEVERSIWNCYRATDLKFINGVVINWGHSVGDGKWACDNWFSECGNSQGGCLVTGGMMFSDGADCNTWTTSDGCSGGVEWERVENKQACDQHDYCYHGPVVDSFQETYSRCSNLFISEARASSSNAKAAAEIWYAGMRADLVFTFGQVGGPGFGDGFQNQQIITERRCLLGRSTPEGYTTPCWGSGTFCLEGTSCYNCCDGSSWSFCN